MKNNNLFTNKYPLEVSIAAFIFILAGAIYAQSLVTQLLMALFISIICAQPISWLQKKKVPQGLAITIVFIGITVILLLNTYNVIPQ